MKEMVSSEGVLEISNDEQACETKKITSENTEIASEIKMYSISHVHMKYCISSDIISHTLFHLVLFTYNSVSV